VCASRRCWCWPMKQGFEAASWISACLERLGCCSWRCHGGAPGRCFLLEQQSAAVLIEVAWELQLRLARGQEVPTRKSVNEIRLARRIRDRVVDRPQLQGKAF
jgi:hypothetical protein